jgi:SAM-dependent methyltransferase
MPRVIWLCRGSSLGRPLRRLPVNLSDSALAAEYDAIFDQRGSLYHQAMARAPRARDAEFAQLFSHCPLQASERLIDVPSGGGYLGQFLQQSQPATPVQVVNLEFSPGFGPTPQVVDPYGVWPLDGDCADRVVCLAATHHIQHLDKLLDNVRRVLRPGGFLHVADVRPDSGIATFLDTFVDRYTSTGHRGNYRNFACLAWPSWLEILDVQTRLCAWRFDTVRQMLLFCHSLFGLGQEAFDGLEEALRSHIGVRESESGIELLWELSYCDARSIG